MNNLILHLVLLKLRIIFDSALFCLNKNSEMSKILLEKNLEFDPEQKFDLIIMFILILAKLNLQQSKKKRNRL